MSPILIDKGEVVLPFYAPKCDKGDVPTEKIVDARIMPMYSDHDETIDTSPFQHPTIGLMSELLGRLRGNKQVVSQ
jgi:hypothetical protein